MKKTLAAVMAGAMLVATQAFAMNEAAPRVADRIGAPAGESSEFAGAGTGLLFAAAAIAAFALVVSADDSESD